MSRLLLGVSGGIAAYKALELVRLATTAGHAVRVIQTPTSERFVGRASFAALSGAPVLLDEFELDPARGSFPGEHVPDHQPLSHLELARRANAFLIAPASANTLAKLAAGLADNLLTSAALAATCPLLVAPAMNNHMYEHAATQANLETLRERGVTVLDPGVGALASMHEWGVGRLMEPPELLAATEAAIGLGARRGGGSDDWSALRVLVTAGGTREPIDSVRFVGNRSSGRMGFALADEAVARGAIVVCVAANVSLPRNPRVHYVDVATAAELQQACEAEFDTCDMLLMAAAVADFAPARPVDGKLKKDQHQTLKIALESTSDVLTALASRRRPEQTVVGFAAEHGAGAVDFARDKLARKRLDAVVVNDVSRDDIGFDSLDNEVTIVTVAGERTVARATKREVAAAVLDEVSQLRSPAAGRA